MSAEWNPPEDDAEYTAWMDNFLEKAPKHAKRLGISREDLEKLRKYHAEFRAAFLEEIRLRLSVLRQRLKACCPEEAWPDVFVEAFVRIPITREPDRSKLLRLLEKWVGGVERAYGAKLRPTLTWRYFAEGIDLSFTIPKPCEGTAVYYRMKGRAAWKLLIMNTQPGKRMYTAPKYAQNAEEKMWRGNTLEFIACGWFENALFGFPSDRVAALVPLSYPILVEAERDRPAPQ